MKENEAQRNEAHSFTSGVPPDSSGFQGVREGVQVEHLGARLAHAGHSVALATSISSSISGHSTLVIVSTTSQVLWSGPRNKA